MNNAIVSVTVFSGGVDMTFLPCNNPEERKALCDDVVNVTNDGVLLMVTAMHAQPS